MKKIPKNIGELLSQNITPLKIRYGEYLRDAGYSSTANLCAHIDSGGHGTEIGLYINGKKSPKRNNGKYRSIATRICDRLNITPQMLFEPDGESFDISQAESVMSEYSKSITMDPEEYAARIEMKQGVIHAIQDCTHRESTMLNMRYGIGLSEKGTLEEIAKLFKVTRTRAQQIEWKATGKLRHPVHSRRLKELFRLNRVQREIPARRHDFIEAEEIQPVKQEPVVKPKTTEKKSEPEKIPETRKSLDYLFEYCTPCREKNRHGFSDEEVLSTEYHPCRDCNDGVFIKHSGSVIRVYPSDYLERLGVRLCQRCIEWRPTKSGGKILKNYGFICESCYQQDIKEHAKRQREKGR